MFELPRKFIEIKLYPVINFFDDEIPLWANFGKKEWNFKEFGKVLE